ncbi:reverse transcriptase [Phytophthora palmivora]|uniref:Reverse transcriptase n=1 Tax=Phytophthora palmivora TaxID=4796 RepID=A0A2P4XC36_9STRA|nr:reverse transcriptase [Phytophthora palmivora]
MFPPLSGTGAPDMVAKALTRSKNHGRQRRCCDEPRTGRETKAHWQACGIATTARPNAESRRAVWASTVAVPDGTDQVGNIGPKAGNVVPQAGNIGPKAAEAAEESAERSLRLHRHGRSKIKIMSSTAEGKCRPSGGMSALLNLEELSLKDFLAELKAGEIAETVLLKPEIS